MISKFHLFGNVVRFRFPLEVTMPTKRFFAVLLALGMLTAAVVTVASVTTGPSYAADCGSSN